MNVVGETGRYAYSADGDQMRCPYCSEWVNAAATLCRHCQSNIEGALDELQAAEEDAYDARTKAVAAVAEGLWLEKENKRAAKAKHRRSTQYRVMLASVIFIAGGGIVGLFVLNYLGHK